MERLPMEGNCRAGFGTDRPTPPFLTSDELAELLRISRRQLQRLLAEGMPYILVGRTQKRFQLATVTTWLSRREKCQRDETRTAIGTSIYGSMAQKYIDACAKAKGGGKRRRSRLASEPSLRVVK